MCQLFTCCLDGCVCDVINNLRSFIRSQDHVHLSDRLDVIARNKCYMFKLFRFVSKLSLLEKYSVLTGRKDFSPDETAELKAVTHSILKRLKEKDFSILIRALETQGGCETPCIFFHNPERLGKRVAVEPQLVLFRIFRLPQIRSSSELKHIASCSSCSSLDKKVCINPYHYSAVMSTGKFHVLNLEMLLCKTTIVPVFVYELAFNVFCILFAYETALSVLSFRSTSEAILIDSLQDQSVGFIQHFPAP